MKSYLTSQLFYFKTAEGGLLCFLLYSYFEKFDLILDVLDLMVFLLQFFLGKMLFDLHLVSDLIDLLLCFGKGFRVDRVNDNFVLFAQFADLKVVVDTFLHEVTLLTKFDVVLMFVEKVFLFLLFEVIELTPLLF